VSNIELKLCPCCDDDATTKPHGVLVWVGCESCDLGLTRIDFEAAANAWNCRSQPFVYEMTGFTTVRRELAEKILLELVRMSPTALVRSADDSAVGGAKLAWSIADAFLKAEGDTK
jgi:hypothetical protein